TIEITAENQNFTLKWYGYICPQAGYCNNDCVQYFTTRVCGPGMDTDPISALYCFPCPRE
ncbi:MAG: hypothetical protein AAGC47_12110, partial [Bacteroidota bacterium]